MSGGGSRIRSIISYIPNNLPLEYRYWDEKTKARHATGVEKIEGGEKHTFGTRLVAVFIK